MWSSRRSHRGWLTMIGSILWDPLGQTEHRFQYLLFFFLIFSCTYSRNIWYYSDSYFPIRRIFLSLALRLGILLVDRFHLLGYTMCNSESIFSSGIHFKFKITCYVHLVSFAFVFVLFIFIISFLHQFDLLYFLFYSQRVSRFVRTYIWCDFPRVPF